MEAALLTSHVAGGVAGLLAGFVALSARKGGRAHVAAGLAFVVAMPINGITAAAMGVLNASPGDIFGGLTTVYLVVTGWVAARRSERRAGSAEIAACVVALGAAAFILSSPLIASALGDTTKTLAPSDYVAAAFYGLLGVADLSVVLRRGLAGKQRIARHLWRMHLGFFIAVGSFFPGQIQIFPDVVQQIRPTALLFTPPLLVLVLMFFWLARTLLAHRRAGRHVRRRGQCWTTKPLAKHALSGLFVPAGPERRAHELSGRPPPRFVRSGRRQRVIASAGEN